MKNTVLVAAVFILALMTSAARAQTDGDTKILLPLVVEEPVYGAYGSAWVTRVALTNTAERAIALTRYWAFISVTNNETQHVTTITPQ